MPSDLVWLEPCPDSVWETLPGGPSAAYRGEAWQYHGSQRRDGGLVHCFRHREHPLYGGVRVIALVRDDDAGPRLMEVSLTMAADDDVRYRLTDLGEAYCDGQGLWLPDPDDPAGPPVLVAKEAR